MDDFGTAGAASPDHGDDGARLDRVRALVRARWADALEGEAFGDDDDFFEAGGHSLLIADIMAGLGRTAGTRLPLRLFFDNPTVNELTTVLAAHEAFRSPAR
ncbi:acyl carrier protein [Streptomyces omiyaensis]|uniref:Acyl carrier protein n=1 Tax=Streptomyces omiyaensis TaxID=68247 RepID=A0ABW7BVQ6_9ACTN|nr:acyl carrier protein [Streptomyces omiyaensis]